MYRFFLAVSLTLAMVSFTRSASSQPSWRMGLEWNEAGISWQDEHIRTLLNKLETLGTRCGINVNGVASWGSMQPGPEAEINFKKTDDIVRAFQKNDFSLVIYIKPDAQWAFPGKDITQGGEAAPEPEYEPHWINFLSKMVERYDGDGIDDMEGLERPVEYYVFTGEIVYGGTGHGDANWGPYWFDTIEALLHVHRISYEAIHNADPSGNTRVVGAGAILWDLYADFPDFPECDPENPESLIQRRLRGENYRKGVFTAGWDSLRIMLESFGDPQDGVECDLIGWHPHFCWRVIDQEFKLIHKYAGDKPIFVDDMWSQVYSNGYNLGFSIPGFAQFNAPPWPNFNNGWIKRISGDFPNVLFSQADAHFELFQKLMAAEREVLDWYYARHAREIVKSLVSAFGEGAEIACISATNDIPEFRNAAFGSIGWVNLLDVRTTDYAAKPSFHTYRLLVQKISHFTGVEEIEVSEDPKTRIYMFERPEGPVYVMWSETGDAPQDLDYRNNPTGETISFSSAGTIKSLKLTHIISDAGNPDPETEVIQTDGEIILQLGYEPVFIEGAPLEFHGVVSGNKNLRNPEEDNDFDIFPNPAAPGERVFINPSVYGIEKVSLIDEIGREYQIGWHQNEEMIDMVIPDVCPGLYFFCLRTCSGTCWKPIIVR